MALEYNEMVSPILRVMLFNLSLGGHYPSYIYHLVNYWGQRRWHGSLDIVVPLQFVKDHTDVVMLVDGHQNINFVCLSPTEEAELPSERSKISRHIRRVREWQLLCKYAVKLKADHCLVMIIDNYQIPIALGMMPPCPVSGIYFRPSFHYVNFPDDAPTWPEQLQRAKEKIVLSRIMHQAQLRTLFCLDSFAVEAINQQFVSHARAVYLPDPVQVLPVTQAEIQVLREQLAIAPDRLVVLLLGEIGQRRGVFEVLAAMQLLPPELCAKLCLLLVGKANLADQATIAAQVVEITQSRSVQIVRADKFIPLQQVGAYYCLANVVLATHQKHVGMSSSLVLAATYQRPVLSSNYGLMGQVVRHYGLGLAVDSTQPQEIAKGLSQLLSDSPSVYLDAAQMQSLAAQNTAERFAQVILQHIGEDKLI